MKSIEIVFKFNEQNKDEVEEERRHINMLKKNIVKVVNKWPQNVFPGPRKRYMAPTVCHILQRNTQISDGSTRLVF